MTSIEIEMEIKTNSLLKKKMQLNIMMVMPIVIMIALSGNGNYVCGGKYGFYSNGKDICHRIVCRSLYDGKKDSEYKDVKI